MACRAGRANSSEQKVKLLVKEVVKIIGRKVFERRIVFEKRKGWLGNIVRSFFSVEIRDNTKENLKR